MSKDVSPRDVNNHTVMSDGRCRHIYGSDVVPLTIKEKVVARQEMDRYVATIHKEAINEIRSAIDMVDAVEEYISSMSYQ